MLLIDDHVVSLRWSVSGILLTLLPYGFMNPYSGATSSVIMLLFNRNLPDPVTCPAKLLASINLGPETSYCTDGKASVRHLLGFAWWLKEGWVRSGELWSAFTSLRLLSLAFPL